MVDKDIESKSGAQSKADAAESSAENYADTEIESHRSNEVHDTAQPPENHGNGSHTSTFAVDGDAQPPENHGNASHDSAYVTVSTAPMGDADGDDVLENDGPYRGVVISDSAGTPLLTVTESADGATITIEASNTVTVDGDVTCTGEVKENQTL